MTGRRDFIGWLGASSLLAAVATPETALAESEAPFPSPRSIAPEWNMTWFDRLRGRQVGVFDSPEVAEGAALFRAWLWRKQCKEVYGTEPSAMVPVVVIRHAGIPLVMDDTYWAKYQIGKETKIKDPTTKKWSLRNPIASPAPGASPEWADMNIPSFIDSGGIVLACNLAFGNCIERIASAEKLSQEDAKSKAVSMLIPGVILQPSGFFAVMKAQETGGGYILAT